MGTGHQIHSRSELAGGISNRLPMSFANGVQGVSMGFNGFCVETGDLGAHMGTADQILIICALTD